MNINSILFFCLFLLLISQKLYINKYIPYKTKSTSLIIIKFFFLANILMLGKRKESVNNIEHILLNPTPNVLVELNPNLLLIQQEKIKSLIFNLGENCLKSIYKIELTSLVSIIISQLLFFSIQPRNFLHLFNQSQLNISIKSEINFIFTFSYQIYFLISDQVNKIIMTIQSRSSNSTIQNLFNQEKIVELLFLYSLKQKSNLKTEVMTSAQLNNNKLLKAQYVQLKIKKILFYSDKILIILISFIICFLVSI